jgi:hypothetical protein
MLLPCQKCTWHVLYFISVIIIELAPYLVFYKKILWLFALNVAEYSLRQETLLELGIIIRILSSFNDRSVIVLIRECLLLSRA